MDKKCPIPKFYLGSQLIVCTYNLKMSETRDLKFASLERSNTVHIKVYVHTTNAIFFPFDLFQKCLIKILTTRKEFVSFT